MGSSNGGFIINVLLVEGNEDNQKLILQNFEPQFQFHCVKTVDEAVLCLRRDKQSYAYAFLSLDYTNDDIMRFIEASYSADHEIWLPVVLISNGASEEKLSLAYDMRALDCIDLQALTANNIRKMKNLLELLLRGRNRALAMSEVDTLTGQMNLSGLRRRFNEALLQYPDSRFIIFYADIKEFKYFNTLFGYKAGNRLLKYWCEAIAKYRTEEDMICRVTGDRIIVVVREKEQGCFENHFDDVLRDLRSHFKSEFGEYIIDIVAGYYFYDPRGNQGKDIDQFVGYARQAQKSIKHKVESGYAIYNEEMWKAQMRKMEINGHLEKALSSGEIMIYAQPQYNYVTGELIGAECLCRWKHQEWGMVSPGEFIAALEETGRIFELDCYVWETACKYIKRFQDRGQKISLSVNVSRKDIDQADLPSLFKGLVDKYQIPAELLRIEITESAYMEETGRLIELVKRLSRLGFSVEMDDFGSGFSSLNLLHDIAIDVLKLDVGFLRESDRNDISGSIVNAVIKMAQVIGIRVLAEGVENIEQAEFLKNNGCLFMQGFFFSRAIPMEQFEQLMQDASISELKKSYKRFQLFNIQELYDRNSSGFFIFNNCMGAAALFDYDGKTLQSVIVNDSFCELIGFNRGYIEESRNNLFKIFAEENVKKLKVLMGEAMGNGSAVGEVYVGRLQKYLRVTFRHVATRDNMELLFCEGEDVTEKHILEQEVSDLQREQRAQMEYIPGGTFRCEYLGEARLAFVSESLAKMMGYASAEAFLEKHKVHSDLIYFPDREKVKETLRKQGRIDKVGKTEHRMERADGSIVWVYEAGRVVEDEQGRQWVYGVITDIDHMKKEQQEKNWYEKKLQAVFEMPGLLLYEYDPEKDVMSVSMRSKEGVLRERVADNYLEKLPERGWIHKDDVEKYIDAIRGVMALGVYQSVNVRALFPRGKFHQCKYHFSAILDDDGKVYRIFGRAERMPEDREEGQMSIVPAGEFRCEADGDQEFDYISINLVNMLGFCDKDKFRRHYNNRLGSFICKEDSARVLSEIREQVLNSDNFYCEYRSKMADGSMKWLYSRGNQVTDADGKRWLYVAVIDLNAYKEEQEEKRSRQDELVKQLRVSAQQDTMTQLYNHNYSLQLIQQELERNGSGAFMMIDVDDFKLINDTRGHIFGDQALCRVANILKEVLGEDSIIGRFGGDEFICYIKHKTEKDDAERLAIKVIKQAENILIADKKHLGVSIGIVANTEGVAEAGRLVEMADKALYQVKRNGKDGYAFWTEDTGFDA